MVGPVIINCEQGAADWYSARMGIPTASRFGDILAKGEGKTRAKYLRQLAGEILTAEPMESYSNEHLERGKVMEEEARHLYAFATDADPILVGFIRNGRTGCSPDALVGDDGVLEIKTKVPHLHVECVLKDEFPSEHKAQCQGALWITEREWVDIAVYWPKLDLFVKRAYRDEVYIKRLSEAVTDFNEELAATVERVRTRTEPSRLKKQFADSLNILSAG